MAKKTALPVFPKRTVQILVHGCDLANDCGDAVELLPSVFARRITPAFRHSLNQSGVDADAFIGNAGFLFESRDAETNQDAYIGFDLVKAAALSTDASVDSGGMITYEGGVHARAVSSPEFGGAQIRWGHYEHEIGAEGLFRAARLIEHIRNADADTTYHRVGNALAFYMQGYRAFADFALLAFTTCMEGLFSTAEQELSFRLSLRVAQFIGKSNDERRSIYQQMREIYKVRSKVVHGAHVRKDTEQAAIYLVESIVPGAEQLARASLLRVLEDGLEDLFKEGERVESLFDEVLFADSIDDVVAKYTRR
jgi:hypothetical protein